MAPTTREIRCSRTGGPPSLVGDMCAPSRAAWTARGALEAGNTKDRSRSEDSRHRWSS